MIPGPSIFIGSSSEAIRIAEQVQEDLAREFAPTVWHQGRFVLGHTTLEGLTAALDTTDFAILILSPDDLISSRDVVESSPRDNVLFELGLFMGRLGPRRTFVLYDSSIQLKLLSDLAGVTKATYDGAWAKVNLHAAIGAACNPIRNVIRMFPHAMRDYPDFEFDGARWRPPRKS